MSLAIGLGIGLPYAVNPGSGEAPQPLRFATNSNFFPSSSNTSGGTNLTYKCRTGFWVGSGDLSEIVFSFFNFFVGVGGVTLIGNAYTIEECALEDDSGNFTPVTFGGAASRVVAANATDIQSDPIDPADFSLSEFPVGSHYWIRIQYSVASAGLLTPSGIPYEDARGGYFPDWIGIRYDPAVNTTTSDIYSSGAISLGAGGFDAVARPLRPIVLGRFVTGDPNTVMVVGDSIADAASDTLSTYGFAGFFARALTNATFNGSWVGGCGFASSGASPSMWNAGTDTEVCLDQYAGYAKHCVYEFGTNQFFFGGTLAQVQADTITLCDRITGLGIEKIVATKIIPRTDSTDNWSTAVNQTPVSADFDIGGDADLYNTWLDTIVGTTVYSTLRFSSIQDAGNRMKWITNGTPNWSCDAIGTHPVNMSHALMADELRPVIAAL